MTAQPGETDRDQRSAGRLPDPEAVFDEAWRRRAADPRGSLEAAEPLAAHAQASGDDHLLGRSELLAGSCRWRLHDLASALGCLLNALTLLPSDDRASRAAALQDLGTVRQRLGDHEASLTCMLESLALWEELGEVRGRADVVNNLGIAFYGNGDLREAAEAYRESMRLRGLLGDDSGRAACGNNLARVLTDQGSWDEALALLEQARAAWSADGNLLGLSMTWQNLGALSRARGDRDAARSAMRTSLDLKEQADDRYGASEALRHLAEMAVETGDVAAAESLYLRAVEAAQPANEQSDELRACLGLSELAETRGDLGAALTWYKRYHDLERALLDEEKARRISALQVEFQLATARRESATDALTGIGNRRQLDRVLAEALRTTADGQRPLSLALLDLDHFKRVNDRLGHAAGDKVLRAVAAILSRHTRSTDLVARVGGEEFALLLPDTPAEPAALVVEELRRRVRDHDWSRIGLSDAVTISAGVVTTDGATTPQALLVAADRLLYRAKAAGRDRVVA